MTGPSDSSAGLERPLERIARYRILGRIGKGAMGVVFAARDDQMERDVALKILVADFDGEPEIRVRFLREAQVAAKLVHPNVVTIFDIGEEDGRLYIVMELLRGQTLADHLRERQGQLDLEWKLNVILQVCDGLTTAEASGISHRDIKPGNLFVQTDGTVKILDFGIARLASSSMTASGFIVGTPDYMSPEQARGATVDPRSDEFSIGGVLYYLLSGRKPFAAPSLPAVLHKVVSEDPMPLTVAEAPYGLSRIVARALSKAPEERYPHISELGAELRKALRRCEADAHTLATATCARYRELLAALAEEEIIRTALGLPRPEGPRQPSNWFDPVPEFLERGMESVRTGSLRLAAVRTAAECADRALAELDASLKSLRGHRDLFEKSASLLAADDVRGALAMAEQAFRSAPTSSAIAELVARCRSLVSEEQAMADRVAALIAQCRIERAAGRLQAALDLTSEALSLVPDDPQVHALAGQIRGEIAHQDADKRDRLEQHLGQARKALARERFEEAEEACRLARAVDPQSPAVAQIASELASARTAHDAAQYRVRVIGDRMTQARATFAAGREAEAIASLESLASEHPAEPAIGQEVARLRAEQDKARRAVVAREEAETLVRQADAALAAGDANAALSFAERALAHVPADERALRLVGLAKARRRETADREERAARAVQHVARAREQLARGRLDKALREADQAIDLDPTNYDAAAAKAEVLKRQEAEELRRIKAAEAVTRAKQAKPLIAQARDALRNRQFANAKELANRARALDPDSAGVAELLSAIAAEMKRAAESSDDTVEFVVRQSDPDDTQSIPVGSVATTGASSFLEAAARTKQRAVDWFTRKRPTTPPKGRRP